MKLSNSKNFFRTIVVVLVAAFALGILPFSAQAETYSLSELIQPGTTIQVGSLTFSILIEAVGIDTPQPGLKIRANNQLSAVTGPADETAVQTTILFYEVEINPSTPTPVLASSLLLLPSCVASGNSSLVEVTNFIGPDEPPIEVLAFRQVSSSGVDEQLLAQADFSSSPKTQLSIVTYIYIEATRNGADELGQVSLCGIEQRFKLAPTFSNAGPDQTVFDSVELDGSGSEGNIVSYQWKLVPTDATLPELSANDTIPVVVVEGLGKSFYDVTLTVIDENNFRHQDTAVVAAAGPGAARSADPDPAKYGDLRLWRFKLKKYKYSNWSTARLVGTFNWPDGFKTYNGDSLTGEVTIKVSKDDELLGVWSDKINLKAKDRRYKYVIWND
jgi:hypothetical protein